MKAFLLTGQSNMSGRGVIGDLPDISSPHVFVWRETGWNQAQEPVVRDKTIAAEGMSLAFGQAVYFLTGEDVGVIPCSLGGSGLEQWMPGQELFEAAVQAALAALKTDIQLCGVLWHQGERDSTSFDLASTYLKRFRRMMPALTECILSGAEKEGLAQRVLNPMPVLVGELGDYLDFNVNNFFHRLVNSQLHEFAALRPEYACVSAHDLEDKGDALHFSTQSQRRLGLRYACAWADVMDRIRPSDPQREQQETDFT